MARLKNIDALRPLVILARNGMKLDDWRDCWRLWIGATEEPFGGFVRDWLFPQMQSGRLQFRAQDVREYAIKAWNLHSPKRPLSEHGVVRAARDLVHTAAQLGMLSGGGGLNLAVSMRVAISGQRQNAFASCICRGVRRCASNIDGEATMMRRPPLP